MSEGERVGVVVAPLLRIGPLQNLGLKLRSCHLCVRASMMDIFVTTLYVLLIRNKAHLLMNVAQLGGRFSVRTLLSNRRFLNEFAIAQMQWQHWRRKRTQHELLACPLLGHFVIAIGEFTNFGFRGILGRREEILIVVWILLEMSLFLFAIEHLPTMYTQDLSIALHSDHLKPFNKLSPLGRIPFYHLL